MQGRARSAAPKCTEVATRDVWNPDLTHTEAAPGEPGVGTRLLPASAPFAACSSRSFGFCRHFCLGFGPHSAGFELQHATCSRSQAGAMPDRVVASFWKLSRPQSREIIGGSEFLHPPRAGPCSGLVSREWQGQRSASVSRGRQRVPPRAGPCSGLVSRGRRGLGLGLARTAASSSTGRARSVRLWRPEAFHLQNPARTWHL